MAGRKAIIALSIDNSFNKISNLFCSNATIAIINLEIVIVHNSYWCVAAIERFKHRPVHIHSIYAFVVWRFLHRTL